MYRPKNCKKCGGKMQQGGLQPYTQSNTPAGAITPTGQSSLAQNSQLTPAQLQAMASQFGFRTDNNQNLQQDLFNYAQQKQPQTYQQVMSKFGQTNAGTFVDGILGARTAELMQSLVPPQPPQPQPQQANLTEHYFGPGNQAFGIASQKYRDSKTITDPGSVNMSNPEEWVDFQYYKPNSADIDPTRGRYRIPNTVWSNQITRGTSTVQDPSLIEQYRYPNEIMASNPIKMKGGRLQYGGNYNDKRGRQFDYNPLGNIDVPQYSDGNMAPLPIDDQQVQMDRITEGIQKGIIDNPNDQWYNQMQQLQNPTRQKSNPYQTLQNVGLGIQAARTGLGWLSGAVERGRQNQYDWRQQTALGQMNAMPASDFQPNPYSLYAKYGGNLKTIMRDYQKWSNDAGPMDMTHGQGNPELQQGGISRRPVPSYVFENRNPTKKDSADYKKHFDDIINQDPRALDDWNILSPFENWDKIPAHLKDSVANSWSAFADADDQLALMTTPPLPPTYGPAPQQAAMEAAARLKAGLKPIKKKGGYEIDRMLIVRKLLPELLNLGKMGSNYKKYRGTGGTMKKGGIHINPENKGKFTEYCGGKVTDECIQQGLHSDSATIRKRANFARNARKWN